MGVAEPPARWKEKSGRVASFFRAGGKPTPVFTDFIKDQPSDLKEFDEALVKRWLKQITIWDDHCTVELKSGLKVDVER